MPECCILAPETSDLQLGAGKAEDDPSDPLRSRVNSQCTFFSFSVGNEQMKVENFEAAVHFYGKAIELNPANAVYFCNRYLPGLLGGPAIQSHPGKQDGLLSVGY